MHRPQDKRTSFRQSNTLSSLAVKDSLKKQFTFASGRLISATRVVIKSDDIVLKTTVHPLNPRRQASLTLESVRDLLPSVEKEGIYNEGVALKNVIGVYELLDSSRRRFAALHAKRDLPLWVLDEAPSEADMLAFIHSTQAVKRLSYRELGLNYVELMNENDFSKLEELANFLSIGRETCRKRLAAAKISGELLDAFPDCEGIPNSFYAKLIYIEKELNKRKISVNRFVRELADFPLIGGVEDKQRALLSAMTQKIESLSISSISPRWIVEPLAQFDDKNQYAKLLRSADKRSLKVEFSRLSPEFYSELIEFIKSNISKHKV